MRIKHALRWLAIASVVAATMSLIACGHVFKQDAKENLAVETSFSAGWRHFTLPGKTATVYDFVRKDGRETLTAKAGASASMMRREVNIPAANLDDVSFSWQVPLLIEGADLAERDFDDSPVRIVLVFEGDKTKFSAKNALLSELAQLLLGEPLPYATLVYVWSNHHPLESVILSPRTDRVRSIVVESGGAHLNKWQDYERNIRADFEKAFGEAPGALLRIAIMTDSDNTQSKTAAWYGAPHFKSGALQIK